MTPQELKSSILLQAIQGKLVDQRLEEGTGKELFQQIQTEKQTMIKAGIIKKEKPLPSISQDELEISLPDSWCWARLNDICEKIGDIDHSMPKTVVSGFPFLSAKDIKDDLSLNFTDNVKNISHEDFVRLGRKMTPQRNDIIFSRIGTLGRVGIVQSDVQFLVSYSCCVIRSICIDLFYLAYFLQSPIVQNHIRIAKTGIGVPDLGMKTIRMLTVPIPPLAEQKRIVAKLEEILPLIDRYETAWNKLEEFNKRFPGDMQKSILQLAIQGKLVEQRPEEGTGEELFQQIQTEKQALIKSGKIKKEKPLPEIADEDIPFDIPDTWKWVHLGDIAYINGGFAFKSTNYTVDGVRVIRISDFNERGFVNDKIVRHPYDESLSQYVLEVKNILLCMTGGTVGKSLFVTKLDEQMVVNQRVATIKVESILPEYVYQVILAPITQKVIQYSKNSTNDNISMDTIKDFLIPLPPLAEQKRIVAKLEEILPLCDRLK